MDVLDRKIERLLLNSKKVSEEQLQSLKTQAEANKISLSQAVIANDIATERELAQLYADEISVPLTEFNAKDIPKEILKLIPEHIAKQYRVILFDIESDNGTNLLAMQDPDDVQE